MDLPLGRTLIRLNSLQVAHWALVIYRGELGDLSVAAGQRNKIDTDWQIDGHREAVYFSSVPSPEMIWPFSWLYLSALGGSGGWVSFSSRPSRLLLDYREEGQGVKSIQNSSR